MKFNELKFATRDNGSIQAKENFYNGYSVSVVAGQFMYSIPRENNTSPDFFTAFEVAVFNEEGEFCTRKFADINDDVIGYADRKEIEFLMCCVENKL
jgi:hypothetical protein